MKRKKIAGVYKITNKQDGKIYVGSSIDIKTRCRSHVMHLRRNEHHSVYLQNAWNKHGEENFEFSILEECEAEKSILLEREQIFLDQNPDYNMLPKAGSRLGSKATEETKAKQAKSMIGKNVGKRHTPEVRAQMLITHKHTEESKAKLSAAHTGKVVSEETKKKMADSHIGYVPKQESINLTIRNRSKNRLEKLSKAEHMPTKRCDSFKRKLTDDQIRDIRSSNLMDKELAEIYPVSAASIRKIRCFKMYRHV